MKTIRTLLWIAATCCGLGASVPAVAAASGAEVGFWSHLDAASLTDEVLDVLASAHGALYLQLDYLSTFGPPGSGISSPLAVDVIQRANQRGVPVHAWLIAPAQADTFADENNGDLFREAVEALPVWAAEHGLQIYEATLDLEFPVGHKAAFDAASGDPVALANLFQANVDPVHQCQAMATYRDTISWAHAHGMRITGSPVPFFVDDIEDGNMALQDALDGVAFPPFGYDALYVQAYRTYSMPGPGYPAQLYRDMQRHFGAAGQVSLGDTTQGPPYDNVDNLIADVRMLAGMGATAIPIFELASVVSHFGTGGLRAIVEAGRQPMSAGELATASQETAYDHQQRETFKQWDAAAVAATNAVTAPPGAPDGPNAYPDGCGDLHALPGAPARRPLTIPALREWTPATGSFQIRGGSRIIARDASLLPEAEVFAEDLAALLGYPIAIASDAGAVASPGDLVLGLGETDPRVGSEGYRLRIGSSIEISAATRAGAFYGTRTVLQLVHQNVYQGFDVPAGEAVDWPRYPERGLMLDEGHSYFTPEWIAQHLREIAYLKMNYFHLHFSDDDGFRIESETHPEIVAPQHLTKQQVRDLIALAGRYHITVVPELDMPGHQGGPLAAHPELQLRDATGQPNASRLDITNPAARQFARELIEEFLPLFPAPYWHMGGDEYMPDAEFQLYPVLQDYARSHYGANANHVDAVLDFFNFVDGVVRAHGKTTRMWQDELSGGSGAVVENADIVTEWWDDVNPLSNLMALGPNALLARGHTIENSGWFPTYYNDGFVGQNVFPKPDLAKAYEQWDVSAFAGAFFSPTVENQNVERPPEYVSPDEPRNLGAKVNIWVADPVVEDSVTLGVRPFLRVIAQKAWNSDRLTERYDAFLPIIDVVGHAPGFELDARPTHTLPEPGAPWRALAGALGIAIVCTHRSLGNRTRSRRAQ